MSKQRTKQPKQQTKQKPLYDHQHSALFDEMTADEALIAQSEATTQAWMTGIEEAVVTGAGCIGVDLLSAAIEPALIVPTTCPTVTTSSSFLSIDSSILFTL